MTRIDRCLETDKYICMAYYYLSYMWLLTANLDANHLPVILVVDTRKILHL